MINFFKEMFTPEMWMIKLLGVISLAFLSFAFWGIFGLIICLISLFFIWVGIPTD